MPPDALPTTSGVGFRLAALTDRHAVSSVLDMEFTDEQIARMEGAYEAVNEARHNLNEQIAHRDEVIREIGREGHSYRKIAQHTGMSYQRVAQLLNVPDDRLTMYQTIEAYCPRCGVAPGEKCIKPSGYFHAERYERRQAIHDGELDDVREGEPTYGES